MGACVSCHRRSSSSPASPDPKLPTPKHNTPAIISEATPSGDVMRGDGAGDRTPSSNKLISTLDKGDKKTFYSRIPPLSRVATSTIEKKPSPTIKDNNNAYSESKIAALFDQYKDVGGEDAVLAEGIERFCRDLDVKPEDFKVLVLAWKFGAEQMCRFSRQEFFGGMKELKTDNLQGIQTRLPICVAEVSTDASKFKELYRFSFKFGLDTERMERILPMDMAVSLWRVVFSCREPVILERWISFLQAHPHIRGIPKDTWNMFLNLVDSVGEDFSNYDEDQAWPSIFDDFVEYEKLNAADKLNQNTISSVNGDRKDHSPSSQEKVKSDCSGSPPGIHNSPGIK